MSATSTKSISFFTSDTVVPTLGAVELDMIAPLLMWLLGENATRYNAVFLMN